MPGKKKGAKRKASEREEAAPTTTPAATPAAAAAATTPAPELSKSQRKKQRKLEQNASAAATTTEDVSDIFASLKGKKKAAATEATDTDAAPQPVPGGKPYITGPHRGYIPAGGNLASGRYTIEDAKARALKNPGCLGFTYEGRPGADKKVLIWLKNKYPLKLDEPEGKWTTYRVCNRVCVPPPLNPFCYHFFSHPQEAIGGDMFMDLRGEGTVSSQKMTRDGLKVFAADQLVTDSGGFTKQCPFDCQCCF